MKKSIAIICILLLFVFVLFGCNDTDKAELQDGVYQAENFLLEGKNVDLLRITVKRDDTFDKFSPQNIFNIDGEKHKLEIIFTLEGEEKQGSVCYADYSGKSSNAVVYTVFKMEDEFLYIEGIVKNNETGSYIDAEIHIGQYTPIHDKVKIPFIGVNDK